VSLLAASARELLDAFASPAPTPGGGSASALAGAIGASLLLMVARMPKTRSGAESERAALDREADRLEAARARLTALVDEDSAAYESVMAAFRRPRSTDEEKAARKQAIQAATTTATETPLAVMQACADGLSSARAVAAAGNPNASSDVRVGIALLAAGCTGACENVAINVPALSDPVVRGALEAAAAAARERAAQAQAAALGALAG
jgi:glutamate formiminotransferase/formiminotetrahydrofolate cyclodeaminase